MVKNEMRYFLIIAFSQLLLGCKKYSFESFYSDFQRIENRKEKIDFLLNGLLINNSSIQRFSILSLGNLRAKKAEASIICFLNDNELELRIAAISALIYMKSRNAYYHIVRGLKSSPGEIRWLYLKYFGELKCLQSLQYLEYYANAGTIKEKCQAILSMGKVSPNYAVEFYNTLDKSDRRIRYCIFSACRQINTEQSTEIIRSFLSDPGIQDEAESVLSERNESKAKNDTQQKK